MKTCSRCFQQLPIENFNRDKNRPDGRRSACQACTAEADRLYRKTHYDPHRKAEQAQRYRERHPESLTKQRQEYRAKNPEKDRANNIVNKAVRRGVLERPTNCSWCNFPGRIEGAHIDYEHPYDVTWLCPRCHRKLDAALAPLRESVERLRTQMDQCVWMLHTAAQEYMTGSRAVISWTDYIRDLESRWTAREEAGDDG